jgi:hypothetical protein
VVLASKAHQAGLDQLESKERLVDQAATPSTAHAPLATRPMRLATVELMVAGLARTKTAIKEGWRKKL